VRVNSLQREQTESPPLPFRNYRLLSRPFRSVLEALSRSRASLINNIGFVPLPPFFFFSLPSTRHVYDPRCSPGRGRGWKARSHSSRCIRIVTSWSREFPDARRSQGRELAFANRESRVLRSRRDLAEGLSGFTSPLMKSHVVNVAWRPNEINTETLKPRPGNALVVSRETLLLWNSHDNYRVSNSRATSFFLLSLPPLADAIWDYGFDIR